MKVFVFDHQTAKNFIPDEPTLAIRIYDSPTIHNSGNHPGTQLQDSNNWAGTLEYLFDDFDINRYEDDYVAQNMPEWKEKFALFDTGMAKKVISDFSGYCNVSQVMIHCTFGWARSPATILGLQKIFDLDIEWAPGRTQRVIEARQIMGSVGNSHVYQILTQAA